MRIRLHLAVLSFAAFLLMMTSSAPLHAGSFFGPVCYGARYTERYPARSHNVFGSAAGLPDKVWHPFWRHWFNKYRTQLASCNGTAAVATTAEPPQPVPASR